MTANGDSNGGATCVVCGKTVPLHELVPGEFARPMVAALIREKAPNWKPSDRICVADLNHFRAEYVQHLLADERGELTQLDREVVEAVRQHDLLAVDPAADFDGAKSFGARLSDRIASFGGSWTFIILFGCFLAVWIAINLIVVFGRPFDPFPFILLNLLLSCLAAIQAPVILMSQNRQEAKDRVRAEHDYKINLKAELEIRLISERLDRLFAHQWQRLLEIQQVQLDLMTDLSRRDERSE